MPSQLCEHLRELTTTYSTFVFPIYGTLHDGIKLNQSAYQCLIKLSELELGVTIFSNVARRRAQVIAELIDIGIAPSLYQHVITAGEQTWLALKERHDPFHGSLGPNCYYIGPASSFNLFDDLPFYRVRSIEQADFILVTGFDEWHTNLHYYYDILNQAIKVGLPLICGSADQVVNYDNQTMFKAGLIANYYQSRGGAVYFHGKPHRSFYDVLLSELNPVQSSKILMVGDSLATDIAGANQYGLDSLLIVNATTMQELDLSTTSHQSNDMVMTKIIETGFIPRYFMRTLQW